MDGDLTSILILRSNRIVTNQIVHFFVQIQSICDQIWSSFDWNGSIFVSIQLIFDQRLKSPLNDKTFKLKD